jgi:ribosome maturation factor RimP
LARICVEDAIEAEGLITTRYNLEVSSPGLDRPLKSSSDFERHIGEIIKLRTKEPINGRMNYKGELESVKDVQVSMVIDGERFEIPIIDFKRFGS